MEVKVVLLDANECAAVSGSDFVLGWDSDILALRPEQEMPYLPKQDEWVRAEDLFSESCLLRFRELTPPDALLWASLNSVGYCRSLKNLRAEIIVSTSFNRQFL